MRGWITAVDAQSGKIAWRAYNTGPDSDVLIGPDFKPFYPQYKGQDRGVGTWPPEQWRIGGGTVWGWVTYDPDQNLIFYGTGNPGGLEPRGQARRQSLDLRHLRPRRGHGPGPLVLPDQPARPLGL